MERSTPVSPASLHGAHPRRLLSFVPAVLLTLMIVPALLLLDRPSETEPLAVFFPPSTDLGAAMATVADAGGIVLQQGAMPGAFIVVADTEAKHTSFAGALMDRGAWLLLDSGSIFECGNPRGSLL